MSESEIAALDAWCEYIKPWYVVDVARDENGEARESRFTWFYALYADKQGGEVLDYVVHKEVQP